VNMPRFAPVTTGTQNRAKGTLDREVNTKGIFT